ncbi:hypothetical protein BU16DRAFT_20147 [Lophium mytilinum]|uniref:Uncharacterized protein n=1 Tax=Lophium mytilinum TaxID=390894 RepID=A0A6A6REH9_9PEZI|nr:hypothetical protein BU16DRAFT_20147 [Lophium mytilinum]
MTSHVDTAVELLSNGRTSSIRPEPQFTPRSSFRKQRLGIRSTCRSVHSCCGQEVPTPPYIRHSAPRRRDSAFLLQVGAANQSIRLGVGRLPRSGRGVESRQPHVFAPGCFYSDRSPDRTGRVSDNPWCSEQLLVISSYAMSRQAGLGFSLPRLAASFYYSHLSPSPIHIKACFPAFLLSANVLALLSSGPELSYAIQPPSPFTPRTL